MSYTGTGTEDDPYLVSTLTDFLTCAAISGAYVKVIKDIDSADDPEYHGELRDTIAFECAKIYADENKVINGVTVTARNFIASPSTKTDTCNVEKVYLVNCTHNKTSQNNLNNATFFSSGSGRGYIAFHECCLSVKINSGAYHPLLSDSRISFEYCSLSFEIATDYTLAAKLYLENCTECSVYIKGAKFANSGHEVLSSSTRTGVVLEDCVFPTNSSPTNIIYSCVFVYIAIVNPIVTGDDLSVASNALYCSSCILAVDDDTFISNNNDKLIKLSLSQMKDEAYLSSVGFLP